MIRTPSALMFSIAHRAPRTATSTTVLESTNRELSFGAAWSLCKFLQIHREHHATVEHNRQLVRMNDDGKLRLDVIGCDAVLDSGASGSNPIGVQIPASAPSFNSRI